MHLSVRHILEPNEQFGRYALLVVILIYAYAFIKASKMNAKAIKEVQFLAKLNKMSSTCMGCNNDALLQKKFATFS